MTGLISDNIGNVAVDADPGSLAPSTTFERVDPLETAKSIGRGISRFSESYGSSLDPMLPDTPPALLDPADANRRFGIQGRLTFDAPVSANTASDMADAKRDEIRRQDAQARSPGGFLNGAKDMAAGMLDPVGLAASAIPIVGEARMAGMLAKAGVTGLERAAAGAGVDGVESLAGRTLLRSATGAANGIGGTVPLAGLQYGLGRQEQSDFSMSDALTEIAMGGLMGGGLHVAGGTVGDLLRGRSGAVPDAAVARPADPLATDAVRPADAATPRPADPLATPDASPAVEPVRPADAAAPEAAPEPTRDVLASSFEGTPTGELVAANPDAREALLRSAVAAAEDDRPNEAARYADFLAAHEDANTPRGDLDPYADSPSGGSGDPAAAYDALQQSDGARQAGGEPSGGDAMVARQVEDAKSLPPSELPRDTSARLRAAEDYIEQVRKAGGLTADDEAALAAIDRETKSAAGRTQALKEAALCLIGGMA